MNREVERYLDHVCRTLRGSLSLRRHLREELREHLEEAIEAHIAEGLTQDEAVLKAIEDFGTPAMLSEGLGSVYGRRLLPLVIEKAMAWKESTMKTGWKWSFVAHLAVGAIIAAEAALIGLVVTYVFPLVQAAHRDVGQPLRDSVPEICVSAGRLVVFFCQSWWQWAGVLVLVGVAFERLYRGESKSVIRLSAGGGVAFGLMGLVWAATLASAVPLGMMVMGLQSYEPEVLVRLNATAAEAAYVELADAVNEQDVRGVGEAGDRLRDALRSLRRQGASAPVLIALNRQDDLDRIRVLLDRVESQASAIADAGYRSDPAVTAALFAELRKSYIELVATTDGWPSIEQPEEGSERGSTLDS